MNDYTFTLTATSVKEVNITASTLEEAKRFVQQILANSDMLNFTQDDVVIMDVFGDLSNDDNEDENECQDCTHYCEECGACNFSE